MGPMELGTQPRMPEITEEDLERSKGRLRYQTMQRYEEVVALVKRRMQDDEEGIRPLDPRYLEIYVRVLKEQSLLARLHKQPMVEAEEEDPLALGVDAIAMIEAQLAGVEAKIKDRSPSPAP